MCRIIFHFFRFYNAEIRRKLWPKAPAKEGGAGQMSKNLQVYSIDINFFKKQNKKNLQYSQRLILRRFSIYFLIVYPHSTVIVKEYFENIPLKSCNIAKIIIKLLSKILQEPCNVRSKHYKWNIPAMIIFHFNIAVM